jgi:hypothetical protein
MLAFIKKGRIPLALLLWFTFVFLIAYLSPGRTIESNLTAGSSKGPTRSSRTQPATRAPSNLLLLDSDNDGFPDVAELQGFADRESFRRWFAGIAELQFYRLSDQWNAEQRDCAGLARFAWREALRRHDHAWFQRLGTGYEAMATDVKSYNLERHPLGDKLFRTDFGSWKPTDLVDGKFSDFADARTLKNFNCVYIGRDRRQAQPGDLLFFYQPWVQKFPYHLMIFLGEPRIAGAGANDWVVYHTGSSPTDQGAVKKVELTVLDHHPDPRWRPVESNRNFLGFYRLKILD